MAQDGTVGEPSGDFRIGDWLVEPALGQIARGQKSIRLRPRAMDVLLCLASDPGKVVSRQRLIDTVWHTVHVTDNVVSQVVTELRTALGDDARSPSYIENIPRRGYRLVAPVCRLDDGLPVAGDLSLFMLAGPGLDFTLKRGENLIGRSSGADIRVNLTQVSRLHARIVVEGRAATVEDMGSKNGTYVNGELISSPTRLELGDEIALGPHSERLRLVLAGEPTLSG